jgi:hypothetical protein
MGQNIEESCGGAGNRTRSHNASVERSNDTILLGNECAERGQSSSVEPLSKPERSAESGTESGTERSGATVVSFPDCPWCEGGFIAPTGILCRACHGTTFLAKVSP